MIALITWSMLPMSPTSRVGVRVAAPSVRRGGHRSAHQTSGPRGRPAVLLWGENQQGHLRGVTLRNENDLAPGMMSEDFSVCLR